LCLGIRDFKYFSVRWAFNMHVSRLVYIYNIRFSVLIVAITEGK